MNVEGAILNREVREDLTVEQKLEKRNKYLKEKHVGRGKNKYKTPKLGTCLEYLWNSKACTVGSEGVRQSTVRERK